MPASCDRALLCTAVEKRFQTILAAAPLGWLVSRCWSFSKVPCPPAETVSDTRRMHSPCRCFQLQSRQETGLQASGRSADDVSHPPHSFTAQPGAVRTDVASIVTAARDQGDCRPKDIGPLSCTMHAGSVSRSGARFREAPTRASEIQASQAGLSALAARCCLCRLEPFFTQQRTATRKLRWRNRNWLAQRPASSSVVTTLSPQTRPTSPCATLAGRPCHLVLHRQPKSPFAQCTPRSSSVRRASPDEDGVEADASGRAGANEKFVCSTAEPELAHPFVTGSSHSFAQFRVRGALKQACCRRQGSGTFDRRPTTSPIPSW